MSTEAGVIFTRADAARIARATKSFERAAVDLRGPRQPHHPPSPVVLVKINTAASGGGKYLGRVVAPGSSAEETGNLTEEDFGNATGADNALILNAQEVGKSTHDLTSGTPVSKLHLGLIRGKTSDGKLIVAVNADDWEDCT